MNSAFDLIPLHSWIAVLCGVTSPRCPEEKGAVRIAVVGKKWASHLIIRLLMILAETTSSLLLLSREVTELVPTVAVEKNLGRCFQTSLNPGDELGELHREQSLWLEANGSVATDQSDASGISSFPHVESVRGHYFSHANQRCVLISDFPLLSTNAMSALERFNRETITLQREGTSMFCCPSRFSVLSFSTTEGLRLSKTAFEYINKYDVTISHESLVPASSSVTTGPFCEGGIGTNGKQSWDHMQRALQFTPLTTVPQPLIAGDAGNLLGLFYRSAHRLFPDDVDSGLMTSLIRIAKAHSTARRLWFRATNTMRYIPGASTSLNDDVDLIDAIIAINLVDETLFCRLHQRVLGVRITDLTKGYLPSSGNIFTFAPLHGQAHPFKFRDFTTQLFSHLSELQSS
jgi:hypothetical protein